MMEPLKLRDMRIPISMSPAMPSHVLALCIFPSVQAKLMDAGGSSVFTTPSTTVHTLLGSSTTYTDDCAGTAAEWAWHVLAAGSTCHGSGG